MNKKEANVMTWAEVKKACEAIGENDTNKENIAARFMIVDAFCNRRLNFGVKYPHNAMRGGDAELIEAENKLTQLSTLYYNLVAAENGLEPIEPENL